LFVRLGVLVNIGAVDLLTAYGRSLGSLYPLAVLSLAVLWILTLVALGLAARLGYRLAFLVGIVLYAADMIALIVTFSVWAFGVHAFFVYKWFQGQKALKEASESTSQQASAASTA
jgi:hypothetical protein